MEAEDTGDHPGGFDLNCPKCGKKLRCVKSYKPDPDVIYCERIWECPECEFVIKTGEQPLKEIKTHA